MRVHTQLKCSWSMLSSRDATAKCWNWMTSFTILFKFDSSHNAMISYVLYQIQNHTEYWWLLTGTILFLFEFSTFFSRKIGANLFVDFSSREKKTFFFVKKKKYYTQFPTKISYIFFLFLVQVASATVNSLSVLCGVWRTAKSNQRPTEKNARIE